MKIISTATKLVFFKTNDQYTVYLFSEYCMQATKTPST